MQYLVQRVPEVGAVPHRLVSSLVADAPPPLLKFRLAQERRNSTHAHGHGAISEPVVRAVHSSISATAQTTA
jgi:hypothetical protein